MPRKPGKVPSYCRHKASGRAVVRIDGRDRYLGDYGSPSSYEEYERRISEWRTGQPTSMADSGNGQSTDLSVTELILAFWAHPRSYYVKNGRATDEQAGIRSALSHLRRLYGRTPAREFSPLKLKAVRQAMIEADISRRVVNKYVQRIRRMFRWGVENELVAVEVYQALMTVAGLRKGRTKARELPAVRPISDVNFDATLPHLPRIVQAMVRFQRLTGCRPEDVCNLQPRHIDQTGETWCCQPANHKMEHTGRPRRFFIGPKAQEVLRPFLDRDPDAYCFSPKETAAEYFAERRRQRKTPVQPSQMQRKRKSKPKRAPGDHYTRHSYHQVIKRACKRGEIEPWHPNQLRHSRGTEVRAQYGLEGSQTVLGQKKADVTQIYAERDEKLARRIAKESG